MYLLFSNHVDSISFIRHIPRQFLDRPQLEASSHGFLSLFQLLFKVLCPLLLKNLRATLNLNLHLLLLLFLGGKVGDPFLFHFYRVVDFLFFSD